MIREGENYAYTVASKRHKGTPLKGKYRTFLKEDYKMDRKVIVVLNNNFSGSYCSNQYFYTEICHALNILRKRYITVRNLDEATEAFESNDVAFSLCLGRYEYYADKTPLYEKYGILNYQWISDDPMKFSIDHDSRYIKYIFIDREFPKMAGTLKNIPLILPLGYLPEKARNNTADRINGILFPGQIRDLGKIKSEIDCSLLRNQIQAFIETYDLDSSYISAYNNAVSAIKISERKEFFRLTNSYIRTIKRIKAIEAIHSVPVFIAGEQTDNVFRNPNIVFIGKYDYSQIEEIMGRYRFLLNVDPNYHSCIHERISRGVNAGALVFSNESQIVSPINNFYCTYKFDGKKTVDSVINDENFSISSELENERAFISETSWLRSLERIIYDNELYRSRLS